MSPFSIASLLVVITMATAANTEKIHYDVSQAKPLFEQFIKDHSREYKDDADKEVHFRAFLANLEKINEMNEKNPSATFGINKFADYTEEERKTMFGFRPRK